MMPTSRAELLDDFQHVRGEEHGRAASDALLERVAERARGHGVHALERLVEEQQIRIGHQRRGQREFLLHAVRIFERQLFLLVREIHHRQQFLGSARARCRAAAGTCGR